MATTRRQKLTAVGLRRYSVISQLPAKRFLVKLSGGKSYRITMRSKDRVHEHVGTYQIVDPPAKLRFTWSGLDNPNEITLVTVEFLEHGKTCELVITHERFTKAEIAQRYEMGWGTIATKLASHLASNKEPAQEPS